MNAQCLINFQRQLDEYHAQLDFLSRRGQPRNAFQLAKRGTSILLEAVQEHTDQNCRAPCALDLPAVGAEPVIQLRQLQAISEWDGFTHASFWSKDFLTKIAPDDDGDFDARTILGISEFLTSWKHSEGKKIVHRMVDYRIYVKDFVLVGHSPVSCFFMSTTDENGIFVEFDFFHPAGLESIRQRLKSLIQDINRQAMDQMNPRPP